MEQLKHFAYRARPFAFGWKPVIREMNAVYVEQEPLGRTLLSWAIAVVAVVSILVAVGKLLLGEPVLGMILLVVGGGALWWTLQRIRQDTRNDVNQPDFLEELEHEVKHP